MRDPPALARPPRPLKEPRSVTHQEFLDQVDAYALGALEPEEARALEVHLAAEGPHPLCEAALARAREAVATLATDVTPVAPPPRIWEAVALSISRPAPPAPREPARPTPVQPTTTRRRVPAWAYGVAAAAVLALVVSGVNLREATRSAAQASATAAECARELADARIDLLRKEDALKLLTEPGTQLVSLKPAPAAQARLAQGSGVVLFNPRGRALFLGRSFPAQATRDYELWLIRDGKPIAAGLLPPGPDGSVLADIRPELLAGGRPGAFAVSIEQKGGARGGPTEYQHLIAGRRPDRIERGGEIGADLPRLSAAAFDDEDARRAGQQVGAFAALPVGDPAAVWREAWAAAAGGQQHGVAAQ